MQVQSHRLEVIANNMANVSTTGFKRDVAIFQSRPPESEVAAAGLRYRHPLLDRLGGGTLIGPSSTEFAQGELEITNNPLDVAVQQPGPDAGPCLLAVRDAGGQVRYTRDGQLMVTEQGFLVLRNGLQPVLDAAGQMIQVDPSRPVNIGADGTIDQGGSLAGQLAVVEFPSAQLLRKVGGNLYGAAPEARGQARPARLTPGAIEKSTVEPVTELVSMIEAQRAYEASAQLIRIQDQTLGRVINDLPRNV
jgi:flagellar basal body rod protein FlgG